jgi:hypothetical protein
LLAALSACAGGGEIIEFDESHEADRLIIRDFIGTLTVVTTEPGGAIDVHIAIRGSQQSLLPINDAGGELTITWEGEPDRTRRWWEFWRGRWMFDPGDLDRYPTVEIRVPADVEVEVENLIGAWTIDDRTGHFAFEAERGNGTIGTTETAAIALSGHATVEIGAVAGQLMLAVAGSGTLRGGPAGALEMSVAGSGEVILGDIAGGVTARIAGSGEAVIGRAASVNAALAGSGSLRLGAVADGFAAVVQGSGSIVTAAASGAFEVAISGSGSLRVDEGRASPFQVTITGSGNARYGGTAVDPVATISGSGGLVIGRLEGNLTQRISGSGRVEVLN